MLNILAFLSTEELALMIPFFAIASFFIFAIALPILCAIRFSLAYLKNKHTEKMMMIDKGMIIEEPTTRRATIIRRGSLMLGLGIGAMIGFFVSEYFQCIPPKAGIIICISALTLGGLGLLVSAIFTPDDKRKSKTDDPTVNHVE